MTSTQEVATVDAAPLPEDVVEDVLNDDVFTDDRLTTVGLLFETAQGLELAFAGPLAQSGLSHSEFEVLLRLARTPDHRLRMSDLSAQKKLSTSGITRVVDRLEKDGLVQRVTCSADRRGFHATLTDAGVERMSATLPDHIRLIDELVTSQLSPDEVQALTSALRKVRDAVRPDAVQGHRKRPVDVVIVGSGARQKDRRHATQTDRHHTIVPGP